VGNGFSNPSEFIFELEELFSDPIINQTFVCPKLMGQHTFSCRTIERLAKHYEEGVCYVMQPFTREKFYINSAKDILSNELVSDLLLIFLYCKKEQFNEYQTKNILRYFVLNSVKSYDYNIIIKDITFINIAKLLDISRQELNNIYANNMCINNINISDICLNDIFFKAVKLNKSNLINMMLFNNFELDLYKKDRHHKTLFFWACYNNNIPLAKLLVQLGADIYIKDYLGNHPFVWAYKYNYVQTIRFAEILCKKMQQNKAKLEDYNKKIFWNFNSEVHINTNEEFKQAEISLKEGNWQVVKNKSRNKLDCTI
jgi:hypothetical protein